MIDWIFRRGALCGVLVLVVGAAGCGGDPDQPVALLAVSVVLAPVRHQPVTRYYTVPGHVISDERIQLSSRISGFIENLDVHEGDQVRRGQVLVRIDQADVSGAIRQASAALESAQADLADAEDDVRKFAALAKNGSIPTDTLRKAEVRRDVAEARLAEVRASLDTARAQRAYTTIVSPVDGLVIARLAQVGDLATPGVPVIEIDASRSLLFQTFVAESRVADIGPDTPAWLRLDAIDDEMQGQVLHVVPSGDLVTRRYEVKIGLPCVAGLLPGMFGRARFAVGTDRPLLVPRAALVERGGLSGVFRAGDAGRAEFRWIRTRREFADTLEVTAGLVEGDQVVIAPPPALRDGDRLEFGGAKAEAGA